MTGTSPTQTTADDLKEMWKLLFPEVPSQINQQWAFWLFRHGEKTTRTALLAASERYLRMQGKMEPGHIVRFLSAVATRMTEGRRAITTPSSARIA